MSLDLTLEEIGKLAGVSRSTVSRVINKHPNVSDPVRERVLEVIRETGFTPNLAARSLVSKRSYIIGLVIPRSVQVFFADPYIARLTQGIANAVNQHDFTLSLFLLDTREAELRMIPRITRRGFIDGVIVQSPPANDPVLPALKDSMIPYVLAGRPVKSSSVSYIDVDNVQGACKAVEHLIELGRRRIGHITGALETNPGIDRKQGYEETLQKHNLSLDGALIAEGDFTEDSGYRAAQQLLPHKPDAIFVSSDQMAIGAQRAIQNSGLRVPQDIALVGYDDLPPSSYANPQITTIRQPVYRFGVAGVEMLLKIIAGEVDEPQVQIMDTELIIRESSGGQIKPR